MLISCSKKLLIIKDKKGPNPTPQTPNPRT